MEWNLGDHKKPFPRTVHPWAFLFFKTFHPFESVSTPQRKNSTILVGISQTKKPLFNQVTIKTTYEIVYLFKFSSFAPSAGAILETRLISTELNCCVWKEWVTLEEIISQFGNISLRQALGIYMVRSIKLSHTVVLFYRTFITLRAINDTFTHVLYITNQLVVFSFPFEYFLNRSLLSFKKGNFLIWRFGMKNSCFYWAFD